MLVTTELSLRLEACIAASHRAALQEALRRGSQAQELPLSTGSAFYAGPLSPLSQVLGWGFAEGAEAELPEIERFYRDLGLASAPIELSPFAGPRLLATLLERGYRCTELSQISILAPSSTPGLPAPSDVSVIELKSEKEYQSWAAVVAKGFGADELATGFLHYAAAPTIHCYAAQIDGQLAAGATMGVDQGIADFGVTSTLPSARGRGAQRALLQRRLRHAQTLGLDVAVVTTEAGSISDRNVQRAGFQVAYTRQKFERPLE